jgi:four helix bundle protein
MAYFEELAAWRHAHELFLLVHRTTEGWPKREWYGLASQVRRSAFSIPANIAEGSAKRGPREFRRYLDIALGSLAETQYALRAASDLGLIAPEASRVLAERAQEAGKTLWGLARALDRK